MNCKVLFNMLRIVTRKCDMAGLEAAADAAAGHGQVSFEARRSHRCAYQITCSTMMSELQSTLCLFSFGPCSLLIITGAIPVQMICYLFHCRNGGDAQGKQTQNMKT